MAGSVNKVILMGRLGQDPEVVSTSGDSQIVKFSLATSERWKDKNTGEQRERTEWHRVVIFNEHLGRIAEQYLRKGAQVYIEGQMQTRKWQDQNGNDKYTTEVVLQRYRGELTMVGSRGDNDGGGYGGGQSGGQSGGYGGGQSGTQSDDYGGGQSGGQPGGSGDGNTPKQPQSAPPMRGGDLDDDIPF